MSRLRFVFAFFAAALAATAFVACGGSSNSSSNENPQTVINNATLKGVHSGKLELSLHVSAKGSQGGDVAVSISGPFQSQEGKNQLPELDMAAKVNGTIKGEKVNFDGGLTLLPSSAYVDYKGTEYEVDPTTFGIVKSMIQRSQQQSGAGQGGSPTACQKAVTEKIKLADFVSNLKNEGGSEVGGAQTTKVSGDLNVPGAIDAFAAIAENPACSSQLSGAAGSLGSLNELKKAKAQIQSAVKVAHAVVYVGSDHIIRRVQTQLTIEPPAGGEGPKSIELELEFTLSGVNESQEIKAPQNAKPLNDLFQKLGVNPLELLNQSNGKGLSGILEGLGKSGGGMGALGGAGGSGGGSSESSGGAAGQQAYLECLKSAKSPSDLKKCAGMLK